MREVQRGMRRLPQVAAGRRAFLAVLVIAATACAAPPPRAAERPVAAEPPEAALRCGLVKRAARTWVGFADGMTVDDMVPAGIAAAEAVRAVEVAVCKLVQRGQRVPVLEPHGPQLKAAAGLEVTKIWWDDLAMSRARVELQGPGATDSWLANLVRSGEAWHLTAFRPQAAQ